MKTIEEVKEHFKKAEIVSSVYGSKFVYDKSKEITYSLNSFFIEDNNGENMCLYSDSMDEFATILTYKTKQMKPKKEETKALYQLAKEAIEAPTSEVCQQWKDKIFEACPSLKKEDELIVGEWYRRGLEVLVWNNGKRTYGFCHGYYSDDLIFSCTEGVVKADPKEVETALIKEAEKRGFKEGVVIKRGEKKLKLETLYKGFQNIHFDWDKGAASYGLQAWGMQIFDGKNGKWAEIINTITRAEAEKQLNAKIVD